MPPRLPADARARAFPLQARMVATNSVRVTFERPVRQFDAAHWRDALNPNNWTIRPAAGGSVAALPRVIAVRPVADPFFRQLRSPMNLPYLPTGVAFHTATELLDGRVLICGGIINPNTNDTSNQTLMFDPRTGTLTKCPEVPSLDGMGQHVAVLLPDGTVLVTGGLGGAGRAFIYHPRFNAWTETPPTPVMHLGAPCAVRLESGDVMVMGGTNDLGIPIASTSIYRHRTGEWVAGTSMGVARDQFAAVKVADGNEVLVFGGSIGDPAERGDGASPWSSEGIPILNTLGYGTKAAPLKDGRVLVVSGRSTRGVWDNTEYVEVCVYDPASGVFTDLPAPAWLAVPPSDANLFVMDDGHIYSGGGVLVGAGSNIQWTFNPSTDLFEEVGDPLFSDLFVSPAVGSALVRAPNNVILAIGGATDGLSATCLDNIAALDMNLPVSERAWTSFIGAPQYPAQNSDPGRWCVDVILSHEPGPDVAFDLVASTNIEVSP